MEILIDRTKDFVSQRIATTNSNFSMDICYEFHNTAITREKKREREDICELI